MHLLAQDTGSDALFKHIPSIEFMFCVLRYMIHQYHLWSSSAHDNIFIAALWTPPYET